MKQNYHNKPRRISLEEETIRVTRANLPRLVNETLPLASPRPTPEIQASAMQRLKQIVDFCVPSHAALGDVVGYIREQTPSASEAARLETTLFIVISRQLLNELQAARRIPHWTPNVPDLNLESVLIDAKGQSSRSEPARNLLAHLFVGSPDVAEWLLGRFESQLKDDEGSNFRSSFMRQVVEHLHGELEHYHSAKVSRRSGSKH